MHLTCLVMLVLGGLPVVVPLAAQGVPRGARVARLVNAPTRIMVANPYVSAPADSAAAVQVGSATRLGMQDLVGDDYAVVTREQMNEALVLYSYPADAILNTSLAVTLAKNIQARIVVTGAMARESNGRYAVTMRLAGVSDEAGSVTTLRREPQERLPDFGERIALALEPAVKSLKDAHTCMAERARPDRAAKAAEKAVKKIPDHGLANLCLYLLARDRNAPRQEAVAYLETAVKGDPLSVAAWRELVNQYQAANDTANVLAASKELLRVAPTDQELRERIFRYFLQTGHAQSALEVAEEGLKIDPYNAAMYDLKANACIYLRNFDCAMDALERMYAADSTKADSLFFRRIAATATEGEAPDTARLLRWAATGVRKYPNDVILLGYLAQAYGLTGQTDSTIAVARRIIALDTTAVRPALASMQALAKSNRVAEAEPFIVFVKRYGDSVQRDQAAKILLPIASARLQGDTAAGKPRDLPGTVDIARQIIELVDSTGRSARHGYLMLGTARLQQAEEIDPEAFKQKSCELARQENRFLMEAKEAFTTPAVAQSTNDSTLVAQYLTYVGQYTTRVTSMLNTFCP